MHILEVLPSFTQAPQAAYDEETLVGWFGCFGMGWRKDSEPTHLAVETYAKNGGGWGICESWVYVFPHLSGEGC